MTRCDIGSDGKTPLQRLHGRKDNRPILELGEKILYMPAKPARGGKWEPRYHPGVFVGILNSSEAHRAGRTSGESPGRRGGTLAVLEMRATPWSPDGSENAFHIQERPAEMVPLREHFVVSSFFFDFFNMFRFERVSLAEGVVGCSRARCDLKPPSKDTRTFHNLGEPMLTTALRPSSNCKLCTPSSVTQSPPLLLVAFTTTHLRTVRVGPLC